MYFEIGDIVEITDNIDYSIKTIGTVRFIEKDDEYEDLYWVYIRANNEMLNSNYDPRFGGFWTVSANTSEFIKNLSRH